MKRYMLKSMQIYASPSFDVLLIKSSENLTERTPIPPPDWEILIEQIANDMVTEHTPAQILKIRGKLYDLLTHCIPATIILKVIRTGYASTFTRFADFFKDACMESHA